VACQKGHTEVVEMLLEHQRIVPNQANESDKVCGLCCLVLPLIQGSDNCVTLGMYESTIAWMCETFTG